MLIEGRTPPEAVSAGTGDAESTGVTSERSNKSSLERRGEHVWNGEEEGGQEATQKRWEETSKTDEAEHAGQGS